MKKHSNEYKGTVKVSSEKPPIWDRLQAAFDVEWESGVIVTYGDTAYCKAGALSPDLHVHEETHVMQQQVLGPERYFDKYLTDPRFRLEQEVEAYRRQVDFIVRTIHDRNKRARMLNHIYTSMSTMYGGMCTYQEAVALVGPDRERENAGKAVARAARLPWWRLILRMAGDLVRAVTSRK